MTKEDLKKFSKSDIECIANKFNLKVANFQSKDELVDEIFNIVDMENIEAANENNSIMKVKEANFKLSNSYNFDTISKDDKILDGAVLDTLFKIILKDPQWIFVLWKISLKDSLLYKLEDGEHTFTLRVKYADTIEDIEKAYALGSYFDIDVDLNDKNRYINLPQCGIYYSVEFLCQKENSSSVVVLGVSNIVYSPKIVINKNSLVDVTAVIKSNCIENYTDNFYEDIGVNNRLSSNFEEN